MLPRIITASPNLRHLKYTFDGKPEEVERIVLEPALALCSLGLWISDHNLFEDLIHRERCDRITNLTLGRTGVTILYNMLKDISPYHSSSHTTTRQNLDSNGKKLEDNNDKWACDYMDEEYIRAKLPFASILKYLNLGETIDPVKSQVKFVNRLLKAFHCMGELVLMFGLYHLSILFEGLGSETCGVERPILHTMSIDVGVTVDIEELPFSVHSLGS
ncbi:hypothetical protein BGX21_009858 [Mortierella sp. AD011]|nr:hypothetical protein BGX21_009858 [Mortierella sp. AD011]